VQTQTTPAAPNAYNELIAARAELCAKIESFRSEFRAGTLEPEFYQFANAFAETEAEMLNDLAYLNVEIDDARCARNAAAEKCGMFY
jgi:hypothetical protein